MDKQVSTQANNPWAAVRRSLIAALPILITLVSFAADWTPQFLTATGWDKTAIGGAALTATVAIAKILTRENVDKALQTANWFMRLFWSGHDYFAIPTGQNPSAGTGNGSTLENTDNTENTDSTETFIEIPEIETGTELNKPDDKPDDISGE